LTIRDVRFAWARRGGRDELVALTPSHSGAVAAFYYYACGFIPTRAGLLHLRDIDT